MLKAMSTYVVVRERLHNGILDGFASGGAQGVEIFAARGHFDYTNPQHVREVASWFRATPSVEFHSMHAPMFADADWGRSGEPPLNIASRERKARVDAMDEIKRAIEVAETAPFRFLIQHVGVGGESFDDYKFEAALSSIEHLQAFARPLGVKLLLENIPNEMSTPEKLNEIRTAGHFENVGFCLDFGHAHLAEGLGAAFEVMAPNVYSTHIHDNNHDRDAHLWPTEGTINWKDAIQMLQSAPHVPAALLEIEGDPNGDPSFSRALPERMKKSWDALNL